MTTSVEVKERTYGGWRRPQSPGVGPLKLLPSVALFGGLAMTTLIAMVAGLWWALAFAGVALLAAAPAVLPYPGRGGRNIYAEWSKDRRWRRHLRRHRNVLRQGLAGVTPGGTRGLPGLLARVQVWSALDALGREYALIQIPQARQWAVVMRVAAQGGALVDPETNDVWVACWGEYLALLGQEGGVVQAAAVVETAPDAGAMLRAHVAAITHPTAPDFAKQVLTAAADELPVGVAETIGHVTLTFSEKGLGVDRRPDRRGERRGGGDLAAAESAAEEIGRRLPGLSISLKAAGASEGQPLTTDQLARRVREAYDPEVAVEFAQQAAAGDPPVVAWSDAGPAAHDEARTEYRHDSGLSRTYEAIRVPPGVIRDSLMRRLLGPMPAAPRKRVTILYRPVDAGDTATLVDRDLKSAINRAGRRKGVVHAHDSADLRSAKQATDEEADGAGVVAFSVLVTVTATTEDDFDRAARAVERAAKGARFRLSPMRGAQAAGFAAALGIGLSLPELSVIPHVLREHV